MIKFMKKHWILTAVFFVATVALAAKITEDNLKLGKPGSSSDKVIEFDVGDGANNPTIVVDTTDKDFDFNKAMNIAGDLLKVGDGTNTTKEVVFDIGAGVNNPRFRWNSTESVLEFSVDGTAFKKIGSGSGAGGGINLLADFNFDFETGTPPTAWTASGGSFTAIDGGAQLYGEQSGSFDASALGQTLSSTSVSVQPGMVSRTCLAEVFYSYESGAEGDYILKIEQVDDSEASTFDLVVVDLPLTSGGSGVPAQINFTCPDDVADTLTMQIESGVANPGAIKLDNAFIGTDKNSVQISQARVVAAGNWGGNCPPATTSSSFVFASALNCTAPVFNTVDPTMVQQGVDYDGARVVLNKARKGTYTVKMIPLRVSQTVANQVAGYQIRANGSIISDYQFRTNDVAVELHPFTLTGTYENTVDGASVTFDVFFNVGSGTTLMDFGKSGTATAFEIAFFPSNANEAITLETSGGDFSVYHGENCLFPRTSTTYGNFTGDASCTFTPFRVNGAFTNIVSALDSGNPQAGLVITSARQGTALICANTSVTENSFDTVLQLRLFNQTQGISLADERVRMDPSAINRYGAVTLCGLTQIVTGSNSIVLQGAASGGAQIQLQNPGGTNAISWHGFFIDQQFPTPVFTDLQNSLNLKIENNASNGPLKQFSYAISSVGTIGSQYGNYITSISKGGTGVYNITWNTTFAQAPICMATSTSDERFVSVTSSTTTTATVTTENQAGGLVDAAFNLQCVTR